MQKSDWALVALNLFTTFVTFICAVEGGDEALVAFLFAAAMAAINTTVLVRRSRTAQRAPERETDELDARTILDLDARLEALERAHADAADAAKWRALVESGQISGPVDARADASAHPLRGHTRNGQ